MLDCLIVHLPKLLEHSPLLGWGARITFLSMGTLSIATALEKSDRSVRILHVGVEKMLDPGWSLVDAVQAHAPRLIALSLHWHPQTYDVLEAARVLHQAHPDVPIVVGGLTASAFAEDILREHPAVFGVFRGEAEAGMRALVDELHGERRWERVPGLSWRDDGSMRTNALAPASTDADMNELADVPVHLIEHAEQVLRLDWRLPWEPELKHRQQSEHATLFGLALGRGCLGTCTWCAGSYNPMKAATGRKRSAWRAAERVAATVERLQQHGVNRFYTCFDPNPKQRDRVQALFEVLGSLDQQPVLHFETFGLPDAETTEVFARHLGEDSRLIISPETHDEGLRRKHRAFPFSNAQFLERMDQLESLGVGSILYYILGLPGETLESARAMWLFQQGLRERYSGLEYQFTWPLEVEPGSPWFTHPERYGIQLKHRTLADFHEAHAHGRFTLGYDTSTLSESQVLNLWWARFSGVSAEGARKMSAHWAANRRDYRRIRAL